MRVTNAEREGISGIIGLGDLIKPEDSLDHKLDLLLLCVAVADHGLLDLRRGVLDYGHAPLRCHKLQHTTGLADGDSGGLVLRKEKPLHNDDIRRELVNDVIEFLMQDQQAPGRGLLGAGCNSAVANNDRRCSDLIHYAISHRSRAWVDAEYAQK